jgi:hypothetical protein
MAYGDNHNIDDINASIEDIEDHPDHGFEANQNDNNADSDLDMDMDDDSDNGRPDSPQAGQKRPRRDSDSAPPDINRFREAVKVKNSKGKPKADDWESDVQEILVKAILFYEVRLATDGLFPDHMQEVTWAKLAWLEGCDDCGLKIRHNSELIKIVRLSFLYIAISY